MTDNEIIKALEDKTHKAEYPWVDSSYCDVEVSLVKNALDLISRLQAENEKLRNTLDDVLDREPILVARAEKYAIEEFADILHKQSEYGTINISHGWLDNLVKERVGEE